MPKLFSFFVFQARNTFQKNSKTKAITNCGILPFLRNNIKDILALKIPNDWAIHRFIFHIIHANIRCATAWELVADNSPDGSAHLRFQSTQHSFLTSQICDTDSSDYWTCFQLSDGLSQMTRSPIVSTAPLDRFNISYCSICECSSMS